jgi:OOP family OmpA-OmpF porin
MNHRFNDLNKKTIIGLIGLLSIVFLSACQQIKQDSVSSRASDDEVPEWKILVQRGDKAAENKDWKEAARLYNEALDTINDPRETPEAPSSTQIDKILRLASNATLLAVENGQSRAVQSCNTMMRTRIRGIQIKKHLIPIQFEFAKSEFSTRGEQAARQLAHCLKQHQVSGLRLIGHTDEIGSDEFNMTLSIQRAKALKKYLIDENVSVSIMTSGRGEKEPLQLDNPGNYSSEEIHALNRRVEVITQ